MLRNNSLLIENFIGNKYKNSEREWLSFFLSPIVTSWYFENRRKKINLLELEILEKNFIEKYEKIEVSKGIYVYIENPPLFKYQLNQIKMGSKSSSSIKADFLNPNSELFT